MAQMNFYVPDEIEEKIKKEAKKNGKSVSTYIAELVKKHINGQSNWPKGYFESIAGKWVGDFPEIEELPEQERDWPE